MTSLLDPLRLTELIVVTGKGGVGKSTVAAVLALQFARLGRRALVLEADPRESLHQLLGVRPSGGEIVAARSGLWLQNVRPRAVVDEVVRRQVPLALLARRVLRSQIYEHFVRGCPGLEELAILGHALRVIEGRLDNVPQIDVVVLDAPASGHAVSLLEAPALMSAVVATGPFAGLSGEVAACVQSPERTAVVAVTLGEEMPVTETLELRARLRSRLDREIALLIVNGLYPPIPEGLGGDREKDAAFDLWRRRRGVNDAELRRLSAEWKGGWLELPLVPAEPGAALLEELESELAQVARGAGES